ncbi:MAG: phosphatidylserine decarboxylase [Gammaproteobacteria bacterium]|nr:MAG: phosphatidylserine decarboxylase [Gammaproteobacteria bacterium]
MALVPLPHHAISRLVFWLTRRQSPLVTPAIRRFVRAFRVDMNDAADPEVSAYPSFNAFFTRKLKAGARPIAEGADIVVSAADGTLSAAGPIDAGTVVQAKGVTYSLDALLADAAASTCYTGGSFATVYLSPRDYHRLHMPLAGTLLSQTHVPGRLFSVAPHTVRALPKLFARNERVVAEFATEHGRMALVLVGAINVAAIETVWHGLVTPPAGKVVRRIDYTGDDAITLDKGAEMGRFNMGSTIVMVFEKPLAWREGLATGSGVRMGEALASPVPASCPRT